MHLKEYKIKKDKFVGRSASKIKSNALKLSKSAINTNIGSWTNKTQLAKLIARKGGNVGSSGYILHIFNRKCRCTKSSKWRSVIEQSGIKFDIHDLVIDWSSANKTF